MAASCAACLLPIVRGQRFLVEGTEVFHARCVGQSYRSRLRLSEQRVRELESQLSGTRRAASRVESEANRLRNEVASAQARALILEGQVARLQAQRELDVDRMAASGDELRATRNELASVRLELEAFRPKDMVEDDVDATVQRFKMLEFE